MDRLCGGTASRPDRREQTACDFDAIGDTIKLASIPSNARINSIKIANDDLDSGANSAFDLGLLEKLPGLFEVHEFLDMLDKSDKFWVIFIQISLERFVF